MSSDRGFRDFHAIGPALVVRNFPGSQWTANEVNEANEAHEVTVSKNQVKLTKILFSIQISFKFRSILKFFKFLFKFFE